VPEARGARVPEARGARVPEARGARAPRAPSGGGLRAAGPWGDLSVNSVPERTGRAAKPGDRPVMCHFVASCHRIVLTSCYQGTVPLSLGG
jgi:hypothetical protein